LAVDGGDVMERRVDKQNLLGLIVVLTVLISGVTIAIVLPEAPADNSGYSQSGVGLWLIKTDTMGILQWSKTYDGAPLSLLQTLDGGYIVAGSRNGAFLLFKTDSIGRVLWEMTYDLGYNQVATSFQKTLDGGYLIGGWGYPIGPGFFADYLVVKTDGNGKAQWNTTFETTGYRAISFAMQTSDGGYIFAGGMNASSQKNWDLWLLKYDAQQNMQWNQTYGGANGESLIDVQETVIGGLLLTGCTYSYGAGYSDTWLVKTDSNGNVQWNKTYGESGSDFPVSVEPTSDHGYILASETFIYSLGTAATSTELEPIFLTGFAKVWQTRDGGFMIAGHRNLAGWMGTGTAPNVDPSGVFLIKTDRVGEAQWNETYSGAQHSRAADALQTSDGGYIVLGHTGEQHPLYAGHQIRSSHIIALGTMRLSLIKIDYSGSTEWTSTIDFTMG
jgi:hypothetical protein